MLINCLQQWGEDSASHEYLEENKGYRGSRSKRRDRNDLEVSGPKPSRFGSSRSILQRASLQQRKNQLIEYSSV